MKPQAVIGPPQGRGPTLQKGLHTGDVKQQRENSCKSEIFYNFCQESLIYLITQIM